MSAPPLVLSSQRDCSGIEFLRRIMAGVYANVPIGDTLGFRVAEAEPGAVTVVARPQANALNLLDSMHGGWAAAILDTAMALANVSTLSAEQSSTTIDIRVNYLRPITMETGEVRARGRVLQSGRRLTYCEAHLTDAQGKLLAHGTGSCLIVTRHL